MLERRWITVDSMRLRVVDTEVGSGLPLVILPGHTSRVEGFDEFVRLLARDGRRVIVIEMPGCGESDKPQRRYDLELYENTVVGALDELGVDEAIPVGGSLGGNLVLRMGHRFPTRFPVLVAWAPGGAWTARPALGSLVRRLSLLGAVGFWASVRIQSRFWYDRDHPGRAAALEETFEYYRDAYGPGFVSMYWGMAADQIAHSLFDIAAEISQPTLLMWGERDNGANMGAGVGRLVSLLPDVRFVAFAAARHSIESEIPSEMAAVIDGFLRDHDC